MFQSDLFPAGEQLFVTRPRQFGLRIVDARFRAAGKYVVAARRDAAGVGVFSIWEYSRGLAGFGDRFRELWERH